MRLPPPDDIAANKESKKGPLKKDHYLNTVIKPILVRIFTINLVIVLGVLLFGFYKGWQTFFQFGEAIALSGFLVIGIGTISVFGLWSGSRDSNSQYARSAGKETITERTQNDVRDAHSTYSFQINCILSGAFAVAIGTVLQTCFGG